MQPGHRFGTTRWSVVLRARSPGDADSREALSALCEAYWYPLYVFVRRQGHGADEARDLTQGYFAELMARGFLKDVRPALGKFRSFLLVSMRHYLAHERRRERAIKRGGEKQVLSLDALEAERRYRQEIVDDRTPERAYEHQWALAIVERARKRLDEELDEGGRNDAHRLLVPFLTGEGTTRSYREVASELDTSEAAVKMAVLRLRRRLGRLLRAEIAQTVADEGDVDGELRQLLSVLRDAGS